MVTPKISVVVPIYKVEGVPGLVPGLPACAGHARLGRRVSQRWLAGRFARYCGCLLQKDARFRLVDKENGGLSSARNAGIAASTASIVAFLDSDDRFTPDACRVIVDTLSARTATF